MIICSTNLDNYSASMFPSLQYIPRKGEFVEVLDVYKEHLRNKSLPRRLEVVNVTYMEKIVQVELWYNQQDIEIAKIKNAILF